MITRRSALEPGLTRADTVGSRLVDFYSSLASPVVPQGVAVMNPCGDEVVLQCVRRFADTFYGDNQPRLLVFGINPGRFGAGVTGVTFTDPVALADLCGIDNPLPRRRELSSLFIYDFIDRMGGPRDFYERFLLTAASPLGFTRDGRNMNYYDDVELARAVTPLIVESIGRQIALGGRRDRAIVLGTGKNFRFIERLNEAHGYFEALHCLEHPRFIMQYRRRRLDEYLARYEEVFGL